jgi:hypothetical protein
MADDWHVGNAVSDGEDLRGWLVGHFLEDAEDVRASDAVEIKWGVHPAGQGRDAWQTGEQQRPSCFWSRVDSVSTFRPEALCSKRKATTPSGDLASTIHGAPKRTLSSSPYDGRPDPNEGDTPRGGAVRPRC